MHGRLSPIRHDASALFAGIPQGFLAVRYHSLVVGAVPPELRVTAWTPDGVIMALEHRARPLFGVQFHPESVSTRHGRALLENFRDLTPRRRPAARPRRAPRRAAGPHGRAGARSCAAGAWRRGASPRPSSARCTPTTTTRSGSTARAPARASRASPSSARRTGRSARSSATTSARARSRSSARPAARCAPRACSTTAAASSSACASTRPSCRSTSSAGSRATSASSSRPSAAAAPRMPRRCPTPRSSCATG